MPASDTRTRHQEGESAMDFGIHFGTRGCLASRDNIIALAQRAEALGYAYLGVADHLVVPVQSGVRYAYTADGIWPGAPTGECFDAIATLAFLAACTQHIKLLTSVAVVPYRPAVLAAKLFLTADVLSGGRVIAGVGSGWMREEFEALGTPPYAERGAVTDEYLTAWKTLWTAQRPTLHGTYTKFENMMFEPKPTSKPHPPIWVGGESPPALRRVAQFGDAWYPVSNNQQIRLNTPERLKDGIDGMRRVVEKAGRDPLSVDVGYLWFLPPNEIAQTGPDSERQLFTGSVADWQEDAASLAEAGARHVILYLQRPTIGETLDVMQRVSEAVVHN
jgi:probable F420-dependent oxidoreductase